MNSFFKTLLSAVAIAPLTACSIAPVAAPADSTAALAGEPLTVVTHNPKAGFEQMTAGDMMIGGLIGGLVMASESDTLVDKYDLQSPSLNVADALTPILQDEFKPSVIRPVSDWDDKATDAKNIAALAENRGLVLEVRQNAWASKYYSFDWSHYGIFYSGEARLIDAATAKVVAQAPCKVETQKENAPTYDELYDNNAALLKAKSMDAANQCAAQISKALFPARPADIRLVLNMRPLPKAQPPVELAPPPTPCTLEQLDLKELAKEGGYRFTANCY